VAITTDGTARRQRDGVVSSTKVVKGSRVGRGPAQGSLSNYPMKLTARGRSVVKSRWRSHAAAYGGR
jgi:hypothetical protein